MAQRNYENWLSAYSTYTEGTEAPAHFHTWAGLFAIATALGRDVWIDMGGFDWVGNGYTVLVGDAGEVKKSTAIAFARDLLRKVDKVKLGDAAATWEALVLEMKESRRMDNPLENPNAMESSPLALMISELGTFLDLENRRLVDGLTDMWDSPKSWSMRTVGRGKQIIQFPCLNILAGTTPNWIRQNFKQEVVGGGLSSRMLFVLGRENRAVIAYPRYEGKGLRMDMQQKLIDDLNRIADLRGEMNLDNDAIEWGTSWYEKHITRPDLRQLQGEKFKGYYARKQTHLHKLAIALSAATSDSKIVTKRNLNVANGLLLQMEKDLGAVLEYAQAGTNYQTAKVEILRLLRTKGQMSKNEMYREVEIAVGGHDFERILADLVKSERITMRVDKHGKQTISMR